MSRSLVVLNVVFTPAIGTSSRTLREDDVTRARVSEARTDPKRSMYGSRPRSMHERGGPRLPSRGTPPTASRVALFDVDGVVLRGKGLHLFARYLVARGEATPALAVRGAWYALGHRLGWLDGAAVLRRIAAAYLAGRRAEDLAAQGEQWFVDRGAAAIHPEAWELVQGYHRAGTPVVLLSGGMDFLVAPVARALGAMRWAAVEPESEGGVLTGRLQEPLCIDEGKLRWAGVVARELGVELTECAFYTDDFGDLALLDAVGERVVVNPDPRLRREAARRGWPVLDFVAPTEADRRAPSIPVSTPPTPTPPR